MTPALKAIANILHKHGTGHCEASNNSIQVGTHILEIHHDKLTILSPEPEAPHWPVLTENTILSITATLHLANPQFTQRLLEALQ